jgi:hypothetical protein
MGTNGLVVPLTIVPETMREVQQLLDDLSKSMELKLGVLFMTNLQNPSLRTTLREPVELIAASASLAITSSSGLSSSQPSTE